MADNTKIWPIFRWANWWLSDDLFTGIKNSFYYSNNMEIRQDAKSIFPCPRPAYADNDTYIALWEWENYNHSVKCVTYSSQDGWWIVCSERYIYLVQNQWASELLCTMPETICDMELFWWYIYISTTDHLYYKKDNWGNWTDMSSSTDASVTNYWRCADALQNNLTHPLYASDVLLCVWDENKMHKVTKEIPNLLQDWIELQEWWYIRFINELGWFIRAVAVDEPYGSEVLLCDKAWADEVPTEIIPLEWYSIIGSAIYWWYHYLLSNKWLWLLNWYQYYLLKKVEWDVDTTTRNCMCVYDDKLYIVANEWIYIYWAKNKNYADVLNLWHYDSYNLWAIGSYKWWIMVTRDYHYRPDWNDPIVVWINTGLATSWEVQTMCYYWTSMSEIKQSMYLRVWYHIPKYILWNSTKTGNIRIYYRTEADAINNNPDSWSWHELTPSWWLKESSDMRSPFATTFKLNCRFQWIQFKFVLDNCRWTEDWVKHSLDTNLYSADLYYNVMLD